ncbi:hypothetical protein FA15DRAFT_682333 [Coprinopsis marcescibilis]|uniref:Zn(2)-C6 fungal-type domain-containing protein n=1 Tax=Coprinopsis marcescibilis TaxID=230819 RepID=A0A5C3KLS4_COPMA|nr:hypothetical protein FA15DRAFT_682333 [Coprinopsis marcescibilis]
MTEQNKSTNGAQEQPYPPPVQVPYPQPYAGPYPPPPGAGPYPPGPYFAYPPAPADGNHGENGQNVVPPGPYMMFGPPGVVYYPQPPQGQAFPAPPVSASAPVGTKAKRKQVKMACTNCAAACKRCDESRPCERCQKYGISGSCIDGQRKERKKGIKRGPYKRKPKSHSDSGNFSGEWTPPGTQAPSAPTATTPAPSLHAVTQFAPPPEGYYPATIMYPPPPYIHPPEGQPGADGAPPHPNGQPPMMPYYIHPGAYPPYGHYPMYPPHMPPPPSNTAPPGQPPAAQELTTVNPSDTSKKDDEPDAPLANGKKRPRSSKSGEPKNKRSKVTRNGKDKEEEGTPSEAEPSGDIAV